MQPIYDIAELCFRKGIEHVVLCPGSRSAPLTLAFARHGKFNIKIISDERSAGFIALGLAQQTQKTCVLVCTSGTAAFNFAPAIAEAFFAEIPLLILTADRPKEWISQQDGQTIFQTNIYGKHVKGSFELSMHYEHADDQWAINRMMNEAINLSTEQQPGPVHVNIPFREPFYPKAEITFSENVRQIEVQRSQSTISKKDMDGLLFDWTQYHNILVVAGQSYPSTELCEVLQTFSQNNPIPILGDIISNIHSEEKVIRLADTFLGQATQDVKKSLRPDLLITFGKGVISKNIKLFLRDNPPQAHWHIQPYGAVADTFKSLTRILRISAGEFFKMVSYQPTESFLQQKQHNFFKLWEIEERRISRAIESFFPQQELGEFEVIHEVIKALPQHYNLHLANSLSVRYANYLGLPFQKNRTSVFSNRGTSGIDGCTSTAVGHCFANGDNNLLITGDVAFFYDRNAFWHQYPLTNLRILLLNNHGGAIFKMIDGPGNLPECDDFFVTQQSLQAKNLCQEFGFEYLKLDHRRKIKNFLQDFFEEGKAAKILEIETKTSINKTILKNFKNHIKNCYDF